ncbi:MAG: biopolymer transporter ExbD, partial [Chitinophagaceae bacterium]|nr:biopolymer transporter ExbD [Chitinophagaceae bacterium]
LTPMVDLGFLLLTFFIFSTALSKPKQMRLILPDDEPTNDPIKASEEKTISIILGRDSLYYYYGKDIANTKSVSKTNNEIRDILIKKKKEVAARFNDGHEMFVVIKPSANANYESIVNILDEMTINDITRHAIVDPEGQELLFNN